VALAVGVDIGGTKIASGLARADGVVVAARRHATPGDAREVAPLVVEIVRELCDEAGVGVLPVGVGAPGIIDRVGVVRYAPNIAWADYPLRDELARALGTPVTVHNDANVAAWGEFRAGAGRSAASDMVMVTVGTGVGGGLVLDGRLVGGAHGLAAELGHVILLEGGPPCPCGNRGCLEALASGTAIGRSAREALAAGEMPHASPLARAAPAALTGKTVTQAAEAGDPFAEGLLARAGFWLGVGIASLVNALDPEMVVVGGGAMEAGDLLLEPARAAFAERLMGRAHRPLPLLEPAGLADAAGFVGAALLAMDVAATTGA